MRQSYALAVLLAACTTTTSTPGDDDDTPPDAPENPGVGCTPTSPRGVAVEAFVAPSGLENRILSFIDGAQTSLEIAMYLWTVDSIADRVVAAKQRGVAVRVLLDPDHDGNISTRNQLTSAGVQNRNAPAIYSFSHQKCLIADDASAIVMSANFNVDAMRSERNYGVVDRDPDDLADLKAIFEQDWAAGGGEAPRPADLACTRLVVSPSNSKTRILELIDGAAATLEVEALYVSETSVRDAIGAAKQRGATVRVILDGSSDNADTVAFFRGQGIEVHAASGFFNHAKLIVADGVAFVGSENYSFTSLTKNREVGVFVFEPGPAGVIRTQFDADWTSTPAF